MHVSTTLRIWDIERAMPGMTALGRVTHWHETGDDDTASMCGWLKRRADGLRQLATLGLRHAESGPMLNAVADGVNRLTGIDVERPWRAGFGGGPLDAAEAATLYDRLRLEIRRGKTPKPAEPTERPAWPPPPPLPDRALKASVPADVQLAAEALRRHVEWHPATGALGTLRRRRRDRSEGHEPEPPTSEACASARKTTRPLWSVCLAAADAWHMDPHHAGRWRQAIPAYLARGEDQEDVADLLDELIVAADLQVKAPAACGLSASPWDDLANVAGKAARACWQAIECLFIAWDEERYLTLDGRRGDHDACESMHRYRRDAEAERSVLAEATPKLLAAARACDIELPGLAKVRDTTHPLLDDGTEWPDADAYAVRARLQDALIALRDECESRAVAERLGLTTRADNGAAASHGVKPLMLPASHYRSVNGIPPKRLDQRAKRLASEDRSDELRREKVGGHWHYADADVRRLWPEDFPPELDGGPAAGNTAEHRHHAEEQRGTSTRAA